MHTPFTSNPQRNSQIAKSAKELSERQRTIYEAAKSTFKTAKKAQARADAAYELAAELTSEAFALGMDIAVLKDKTPQPK